MLPDFTELLQHDDHGLHERPDLEANSENWDTQIDQNLIMTTQRTQLLADRTQQCQQLPVLHDSTAPSGTLKDQA